MSPRQDVWQRLNTQHESEIGLEPHSRSLSHGADDSPRFRAVVEHGANVQDKYRRHRVCPYLVNEHGCPSIEAGRRKKTTLARYHSLNEQTVFTFYIRGL